MRPSTLFSWPALETLKSLPQNLPYERGIWGKAHGQRTDYRWLALSDHFPGVESAIERDLLIGTEDHPRPSTYWQSQENGYFAFKLYRSRARDVAGRSGFSEKQILALERSPQIPAALGALTLLPLVAELNDEVWWSRQEQLPLDAPLKLDSEHHRPLSLSLEQLEATIARGCEGLKALGEDNLTALYSAILNRKQGWLLRRPCPIEPESLAVLLLPLPQNICLRLSMASWIPSHRADTAQLGRWHVIAQPIDVAVRGLPDETAAATEKARIMARALLHNDPHVLSGSQENLAHSLNPELNPETTDGAHSRTTLEGQVASREAATSSEAEAGHPQVPDIPADDIARTGLEPVQFELKETAQDTTPPTQTPSGARRATATELEESGLILSIRPISSKAPPAVRELYEFARHAGRRWLDPQRLRKLGHGDPRPNHPADVQAIQSWPLQVWQTPPSYSPTFQGPLAQADRDQWAVKTDLLRAAALVLVPDPSTIRNVGNFMSKDLIPPLLFLEILSRDSRDQLVHLGEDSLRDLITRSRSCCHAMLRDSMIKALKNWSKGTENPTIRRLLPLR